MPKETTENTTPAPAEPAVQAGSFEAAMAAIAQGGKARRACWDETLFVTNVHSGGSTLIRWKTDRGTVGNMYDATEKDKSSGDWIIL